VRPTLARLVVAFGVVAALALTPQSAYAQAFTAPEGVGAVTVAWQIVDNTGHRFTDGLFLPGGESVTMSALAEFDYSFTDRLAVTAGLPYVFAKYTGAQPPFSGLPVDTCACWHSGFQDFSLSGRYRFGTDIWAVTPLAAYGQPSHDYPFQGEAVVGRNLRELRVGVSAGLRLVDLLPKASIQGSYTYGFVERALDDVDIDRSNASIDFGYALTSRLYLRGSGIWQHTHGGLRVGSPSGNPFLPLGELINPPERFAQRDRVQKSNYWHLAGGVSFDAGPVDLFAAYTKYVWGTDTHNGQAFTFGSTWYFDLLQ
jgi:hypothetical protein